MGFRILADVVLGLHLGFVVFASLGALLALRWPRVAWVHVPAAGWAAAVEILRGTCPLTPLESWLRVRGGAAGYETSFVEHWLGGILYPEATRLTPEVQLALGLGVIALNVALYSLVIRRRRRVDAR